MQEILPRLDVETIVCRVRELLTQRRLWRGDGLYSRSFEERFAALCKRRFGALTGNGSQALEAAVDALDALPGDEIIVPAFAFIAVAASVLQRGLVPVPVDVEETTFNLDATRIAAAASERTRAIIVAHFAGCPCEMHAILAAANSRDLPLIEDGAQAHFAKYGESTVGSFGLASCFSFQAAKTITSGEGGILLTDDERVIRRTRAFINYGRDPDDCGYDHRFLSSNARLPEIAVALLLDQLDCALDDNETRMRSYQDLAETLQRIPELQLQQSTQSKSTHAHSLIPVLLPAWMSRSQRDALVDSLKRQRWPVRAGYPLLTQTGIVRSARARGLISADQESRIEEADRQVAVARRLAGSLVVFNHSILYRKPDELAGLAEHLQRFIGEQRASESALCLS